MASLSRQNPAPRALQVLCASGGCMEKQKLLLRLASEFKAELVERALNDPRRFTMVTREEPPSEAAGPGRSQSPGESFVLVIATTGARLCPEHGSGKCAGDCGQLHVCRFFVYGQCRHQGTRKQCKFIHDFHSSHNFSVLKQHGLESLSSDELCQLLLQNDASLLPEVCTYYNKGEGPYGSCTFQKICVKLHICQYYLQGECRFGSNCKRSHDVFNSDCYEKLEKRGMSQNLISKIPLIYKNAYGIKNSCSTAPNKERRESSGHTPLTTNNTEESDMICLYHIRKNCSFQDKCIRVHYHLPYKWQIFNGTLWEDLSDMEAIEKAFCDPFNERTSFRNSLRTPFVIDFSSMTCGTAKVRRLSTASSVTKPPHYILTTDWIWYWKDEYGVWMEYGVKDDDRSAATVTSADLEKVYQSETSPKLKFLAGKHEYEIDFKAMKQKNLRYLTERSICRRPKFVSLKEVADTKTRGAEQSKTGSTHIPSHWDKSAIPEIGCELITLLASSNEYRKVQINFQRTMPKAKIVDIKRIQNLALWEVYQWQKEQMKKANGGKDVDERLLFHGTSTNHVDAICQQNFDWRICGVHGTAYGKGSYFARDAAYSDNYSKTDSLRKTIFLARVLVGEFTTGASSYLRPPVKPNQNTVFYDSCVNDVKDPSIFVVFEKHQIYPEYLIRYSK